MTAQRLAITGNLRSGKSLLTTLLVGDYGFREVAFGDALKRFAHAIFPQVPREPKPRALLQAFGQAMRNMPVANASNVWVDHAMDSVRLAERLAQWDGEPARIVVSDLRQPNEYAALKERGFTIIRVVAPVDMRLERARREGDSFTEADLAHETESHVDGFAVDYEVANDTDDIRDLQAKVDAIMAELGVDKREVAWP